MFRFHTVAAVLIGTCLASATAFAAPDSKGTPAPVPQQLDAKYLTRAEFVPGLSTNGPSMIPQVGSQVYLPGHSSLGTCLCAGSPPEGEANCGIPDTFNGGCNITPQLYSVLPFPGSVCGTAAWDGSIRDTDWYRFTLTGASTNVQWKVNAEFANYCFILDNACPATILAVSSTAPACADAIASAAALPAGTYVAWAGPDFNGPVIVCGTSDDYKGTLATYTCTPPANNSCAAATAIAGNGPFTGNNICATLDGPQPTFCAGNFSKDIWLTWTANTTGVVNFNLCNPGTNYDSMIAIYDGATCVGTELGCDDDGCGPVGGPSQVAISVVNGNPYKIQLGGWGGGEGTYELTIGAPPPPPNFSVCQHDDGASERAWTLSGAIGEEMVWLNRYGSVGDVTLVSAISGTFGSPADPFTASPNGTAVRMHIWDDPNDDGDPIDAVLLQSVASTVQFSDTDTFQTSALAPSVTVNGAYFVGLSIVTTAVPAQQVNMSIDYSLSYPSLTWIFGNPGGLADVNTLSNNSFSLDMDTFDPGVWMIRTTCGPAIAGFCFPGQGGIIPCPCANPPSGPGRSCNNFGQFTGGAALVGSGNASLSADTLVLSATGENNTALTVFWGGNTAISPGFPNGAGVRCIAVNLKRLYKGNASGGAIARPGMADPRVHIAQGGIVAGNTRYYYNTYRDPNAAGPCGSSSSTINTTNGVAVTWTP